MRERRKGGTAEPHFLTQRAQRNGAEAQRTGDGIHAAVRLGQPVALIERACFATNGKRRPRIVNCLAQDLSNVLANASVTAVGLMRLFI